MPIAKAPDELRRPFARLVRQHNDIITAIEHAIDTETRARNRVQRELDQIETINLPVNPRRARDIRNLISWIRVAEADLARIQTGVAAWMAQLERHTSWGPHLAPIIMDTTVYNKVLSVGNTEALREQIRVHDNNIQIRTEQLTPRVEATDEILDREWELIWSNPYVECVAAGTSPNSLVFLAARTKPLVMETPDARELGPFVIGLTLEGLYLRAAEDGWERHPNVVNEHNYCLGTEGDTIRGFLAQGQLGLTVNWAIHYLLNDRSAGNYDEDDDEDYHEYGECGNALIDCVRCANIACFDLDVAEQLHGEWCRYYEHGCWWVQHTDRDNHQYCPEHFHNAEQEHIANYSRRGMDIFVCTRDYCFEMLHDGLYETFARYVTAHPMIRASRVSTGTVSTGTIGPNITSTQFPPTGQ